jgi:hypothetical protein
VGVLFFGGAALAGGTLARTLVLLIVGAALVLASLLATFLSAAPIAGSAARRVRQR